MAEKSSLSKAAQLTAKKATGSGNIKGTSLVSNLTKDNEGSEVTHLLRCLVRSGKTHLIFPFVLSCMGGLSAGLPPEIARIKSAGVVFDP
jgi:hypothetical protein